MSIQNIGDIYTFLDTLPSFKAEGKDAADFSLERFRSYCEAVGNPQDQFSSVHVAGSNGKGSVCQLIASVYCKAGYKVGVYSSPHIVDYEERFTVNGNRIGEAELIDFFQAFLPKIKSFRLTYFEVSTAVAFWWFAQQKVDVALIETGLGGRLDATNVIKPLAAVITTVTMDHTDILGDTIGAIAAEKAGIIKPRVPVVLGNLNGEAKRVIYQVARDNRARVIESTNLKPKWIDGYYQLSLDSKHLKLNSTLRAPIQAYNIAVAWSLTTMLEEQLPVEDTHRKEGIEQIGRLFPNRGRFERLSTGMDWYFDGAHNLQAVRALKKTVETIQPVSQTVLVLSLMRDKINEKMMKEFLEFEKIIYHTLPLGRAASFDYIQEWVPRVQSFPAARGSRDDLFKELETKLVIFAGSFYFYSTVRDWLSMYMIDR